MTSLWYTMSIEDNFKLTFYCPVCLKYSSSRDVWSFFCCRGKRVVCMFMWANVFRKKKPQKGALFWVHEKHCYGLSYYIFLARLSFLSLLRTPKKVFFSLKYKMKFSSVHMFEKHDFTISPHSVKHSVSFTWTGTIVSVRILHFTIVYLSRTNCR